MIEDDKFNVEQNKLKNGSFSLANIFSQTYLDKGLNGGYPDWPISDAILAFIVDIFKVMVYFQYLCNRKPPSGESVSDRKQNLSRTVNVSSVGDGQKVKAKQTKTLELYRGENEKFATSTDSIGG